jgi:hypothetical protein
MPSFLRAAKETILTTNGAKKIFQLLKTAFGSGAGLPDFSFVRNIPKRNKHVK